MRDYYEELWQALPRELTPPDLAVRRRFAQAHVGAGDDVLDLGCGDGTFAAQLARQGARITGADVAEAALARARTRAPGVTFVRVDVDGPLPLADNAFDVVWASEVIEHVADTARWLSEARRVLRPRGRLLLSTPNHPRLALLAGGIERFSQPLGDHLHLYTTRSLRGLLGEFGFAEIDVRAVGGPPGLRRLLLARAVR